MVLKSGVDDVPLPKEKVVPIEKNGFLRDFQCHWGKLSTIMCRIFSPTAFHSFNPASE